MENPTSPSKKKDGTAEEEEGEYDSLFSIHHVRTASVILRSGDRVRRKVSLLSIYDENPFEEDDNDRAALLDPSATAGTSYSSIAPCLVDRQFQLWETPSCVDKFKLWLQSEGLKRYLACSQ
jgi:hypothetical protein